MLLFRGRRWLIIFDFIIIGGGPAGLSAAITARARNKSVAVVSGDITQSGFYKAREIDNYPGLPGISGSELASRLTAHAAGAGASLITGRVYSVLPGDGLFQIGYGNEVLEAKCVVLATGVSQTSLFPGEEKLLGSGVSYCATCDGMLFRGKRVCVVCLTPDADGEADYLASLGCDVVRLRTKNIVINGDTQVDSVTADGEEIKCEGIFVMRPAVAPHLLISGIETLDGHIKIGASCETNIPGVFAAGDCTGKPYQVAKAVGQGQIAVLSAVEGLS